MENWFTRCFVTSNWRIEDLEIMTKVFLEIFLRKWILISYFNVCRREPLNNFSLSRLSIGNCLDINKVIGEKVTKKHCQIVIEAIRKDNVFKTKTQFH